MPAGAADHAAQDAVGLVGAGAGAIGDGERRHSGVVGDGPEGDVLGIIEPARVCVAADLCDGVKQGREDVGVVVAGLPLDDGGDALEAHAGIDVLGGQGA